MKKRALAGAVIVATLTFGVSGSAVAGERTGAGGATPISVVAKSECAFSGLDDFDFVSAVQPGVVQNWGVIVAGAGGHLGGANSVLTPFGLTGCNAHDYAAK